MDDPLPPVQYSAHSDRSEADDQGSLELQETPSADSQSAQIVPIAYGNAC